MKTNREAEFSRELFNLVRERVRSEGLDSIAAMSAAVDEKPHEVSGYVSAMRDDRPWCVGTSLFLLDQLGWDLTVGIGVDAAG